MLRTRHPHAKAVETVVRRVPHREAKRVLMVQLVGDGPSRARSVVFFTTSV
jgi:hypothetical protein